MRKSLEVVETFKEVNKIRWQGAVERRYQVNDLLLNPGDTTLVLRSHPRLIVMMCPCGCGDQIVINVDPNAGPAWSVYCVDDNFEELTIYPSIWRDTGCGSHFIVWRGNILGIGLPRLHIDLDAALLTNVARALGDYEQHFSAIANELSENPWSVLWVCQHLVRERQAVEGDQEGTFKSI